MFRAGVWCGMSATTITRRHYLWCVLNGNVYSVNTRTEDDNKSMQDLVSSISQAELLRIS
jgi:hypothetical protein